MKERTRRPPARPASTGAPRRAPGGYAPPRGRSRGASSPAPRDAVGTRTGPRARAAQKRGFDDPFQRAQRPARDAVPRERLSAPGVIRLDPDVARVFRDAESVNEALRLVLRLARFGAGPPREYTPRSDTPRSAGPRSDAPRSAGPRSDAPRSERPARPPRERRDAADEAPATDEPRFDAD